VPTAAPTATRAVRVPIPRGESASGKHAESAHPEVIDADRKGQAVTQPRQLEAVANNC